jgi:hypothetical protein
MWQKIRFDRIKNSKNTYEFGLFINFDTELKYVTISISFVKSLMFSISWDN